MKKFFVVNGLICCLISSSVMAAGQVNFKGVIVDSPCGIAPQSIDQTIDFGQLSLTHLNSGGISNPIPLQIELVNCALGQNKQNTVSVKFTGSTVGSTTDVLGTTGNTGTGIVINDVNGNIQFNTASNALYFGGGSNIINFSAWVKKADATTDVKAGTFSAVTNFTLEYL